LKAKSNNPVFINSCEFDEVGLGRKSECLCRLAYSMTQMFPAEKQKMTDDMLGNGQYKPGYTRAYFPGCSHGFACRGDPASVSFSLELG
jgi:hypothetical protein